MAKGDDSSRTAGSRRAGEDAPVAAGKSADLAGDHPQQRTAEAALEHQLHCQTLISEISHHFLALPVEGIAQGIQEKLPLAAELADAESVSLVMLDDDANGIEQCCSWSAPGSDATPLRSNAQTASDFSWCVKQLISEKAIHIPSVDGLPEEAAAKKADLRRRGVLSSLTIPVRSVRGLGGFFAFERISRAEGWSDSKIEQLRVVVEIFAAAIDRQRRSFALRESEERFRAMTEHATELVAEIDADGNYQYVSPSYRDLLGHQPDELIGLPSSHLVHPEDLPEVEATFRSAFDRCGKATAIARLRHARGSWRWIESSGRVFRTARGELHLVSIGRDVTRRIEMERAIQRHRESEQRVAELSRHFLQLGAAEIEDAIRSSLEEVADLAGADRASLAYLRRAQGQRIPYYVWPPAGTDGEVEADPAEQGRWKTMLWSAANFMRNEPTRIHRTDDLPPEADAERAHLTERGILSLLSIPIYSGATPMGCLTLECTREERDWSEQDITLLRLIGELFTGALRRRQTESALDESREQLLHATKMDAVGRLAGGIAHDFNNLLTIILGFCRPLLSELAESDPIREDIAAIRDSAERAAALTRQLLTFSRRQDVETEALQLNDLLVALEPMLERLVGDDVDLGLELAGDLDWVEGDAHHLEQLVLNIAANARDAMPDGGSFVMRTRNREISRGEAKRLRLPRAGRFVSLELEDTGTGMDEQTRQHIFDPFFTTKEADKGTGLGLSLVYGIVEQMGGTISVEAEPGKGTCFHILLPLLDEPTPAQS